MQEKEKAVAGECLMCMCCVYMYESEIREISVLWVASRTEYRTLLLLLLIQAFARRA